MFTGINVTCFAYGMTGAGKTHTMLGDIYRASTGEPGICSMAIDAIFSVLHRSAEATPKVKMSYLEIYNEQIKDLLVARTARNSTLGLMVLEDPVFGVTVPDLSEHEVHNSAELLSLVLKGNEARTMAATKGNQFSSRSHAILQISVQAVNDNSGTSEIATSKLSLVDLAGSEKAGDPKGIRMMEGGKINRSLLALGNCINILSDKAKSNTSFVPYRDSKLTRLLKDSLGGNTKTVMIGCVSQMPCHHDETINTLKYAERAKKITKKVTKNVREVEGNIEQYKEIIKDLRAEILTLKEKVQGGVSSCAPQGVPTYELEQIDAEIAKMKDTKAKYQAEVLNSKEEEVQALDMYTSICTEDEGYISKLSHDLLIKYEEHYEIKESIQELVEINEKNSKLLQQHEEELNGLEKQKPQSSKDIEKKLAEVDALKKTIESNEAMKVELEKLLEENIVMQQRYLSLVVKLQSQKKKDVLELQIVIKDLRAEKIDLVLENLEMKKLLKLGEAGRSGADKEIALLKAELQAAKESLKQQETVIQTSKTQLAIQAKELDELKKTKRTATPDLETPDNVFRESTNSAPDEKPCKNCPSFESVSTVRGNQNDASENSALNELSACIAAIVPQEKPREAAGEAPFRLAKTLERNLMRYISHTEGKEKENCSASREGKEPAFEEVPVDTLSEVGNKSFRSTENKVFNSLRGPRQYSPANN